MRGLRAPIRQDQRGRVSKLTFPWDHALYNCLLDLILVHEVLRQVNRRCWRVWETPLTQNIRRADALRSSESLLLGGAIVPLYSA